MTEDTRYQDLYRSTIPSVVSIYLVGDGRGPGGAGSGFVFGVERPDGGDSDAGDDGFVVTNEHVVRGSEHVDVRFSGGEWRVGDVVGVDAYTDLAVVRVPDVPASARPLPLAANTPAPGTSVAALGNPMGLDGSISVGVVSGSNRSMYTREGFAIPDTVQTDAPINPGNSGGPLVTVDGDVVGINRARGGDNIGFAVSAEVAARVVPELVEHGEYRHSYLKVRTLDVSPSVAEANGLLDTGGVLVVDVSLGPASGALVGARGSRTVRGREIPVGGDVIRSVDGDPVDSHEGLMRYLLLETTPGDTVELELLRRGERLTERVTLGERPAPRSRRSGRRGGSGRIPIR